MLGCMAMCGEVAKLNYSDLRPQNFVSSLLKDCCRIVIEVLCCFLCAPCFLLTRRDTQRRGNLFSIGMSSFISRLECV